MVDLKGKSFSYYLYKDPGQGRTLLLLRSQLINYNYCDKYPETKKLPKLKLKLSVTTFPHECLQRRARKEI